MYDNELHHVIVPCYGLNALKYDTFLKDNVILKFYSARTEREEDITNDELLISDKELGEVEGVVDANDKEL